MALNGEFLLESCFERIPPGELVIKITTVLYR